MDTDREPGLQMICRRERRYVLTYVLVAAERELTIPEIEARLEALGFTVYPPKNKRISDGLRVPLQRGWVVRVRRGTYRAGRIPKTSLRRIRLVPGRLLRGELLTAYDL